ncbi:MAG: ABC transporter ATP-binding protein, partial [Alphaproteobacteria bacterium]|nr:ABC transporter ATP-binding protein [Alphaproteobacteria bacterium]
IAEPLRIHKHLARAVARDRALEMLERVGIPQARQRIDDYPHQLSGGMRQRVMIAIALACRPALLIADEPTTALDVTIQAQILDLIREACTEVGTAVLLITHDLGVAARMCDHVGVMYAGRLVELGTTETVFARCAMPYTAGLLGAIPHLGADRPKRLPAIPGAPPNLLAPPAGCRFAPRCGAARPLCESDEPPLSERAPGHLARCRGTEPEGWLV